MNFILRRSAPIGRGPSHRASVGGIVVVPPPILARRQFEDDMLKKNLELDLNAARRHVELLTGDEFSKLAWQVFPDYDKKRRLARSFNGRLEDVVDRFKLSQREGCGVFVAVNETDGKGRKEGNITSCRAVFLDLDGTPLPRDWPMTPDLIIQSSSAAGIDKYQCWWMIEPTTDFARWKAFQELLADSFGGDPKGTLLTQVGRLAGTWHQKNPDQPFQVRIITDNAAFESRWSLDWLADQFGFDLSAAPGSDVENERSLHAEPAHGWDDPHDVARAIDFIRQKGNWRETSDGAVSVYGMACSLRDLGISPEQAEELVDQYLPIAIPSDWPDDHVTRKVANAYHYAKSEPGTRSIAAAAADFPDDVDLGSVAEESAPKKRFGFTPYVSRDPKTIEARAWLYKPSYVRQFTTGTLAHGGVGKSTLLTAEAVAMAAGKPILGVTPVSRLRVAYWNGEDPMDELARKVEAVRKRYQLEPADLDGWLFLDTGRELPIRIATQDRTGTRIAKPMVDGLIAALKDAKIDVLIIDPFVSSHAVSENDNSAIEQVSRTWNEIAQAANCAVHLAHHSVKARGRDAEGMDFRGGGAALAKLRHLRVLNPLLPKVAKKLGISKSQAALHFRADQGKGNLAPPSADETWFRMESVSLGNANIPRDGLMAESDKVGVVVHWIAPEAGLDPTLEQIEDAFKLMGDKVWRKTSQSKEQWVGAPIGKALGLSMTEEVDRKELRLLITQWVDLGILVVKEPEESDANGNKREGYAVGKPPSEDEEGDTDVDV
ncbi:MAG: AAA family ATPase [Devosia sp.]|nr:AAA family ATPase [Devosia sp.]